jgi:hypothetical protein
MSDARRSPRWWFYVLGALLVVAAGALALQQHNRPEPPPVPNASNPSASVRSTVEEIGWMRLDPGPAPGEIGAVSQADLPSFYRSRYRIKPGPRICFGQPSRP